MIRKERKQMNKIILIVLLTNISLQADLLSDGIHAYENDKLGKALRLLNKACQKDNAAACFKLGEIYKDGENATEDKYTAQDFYRMSCDLDLDKGCKEYRKMHDPDIK